MLAAIYGIFFVCVTAVAARVTWQSIAGQKGRITALLSADRRMSDGRIVTVSIAHPRVFVPATAPTFGSTRVVALAVGSPFPANRGWLVGESNLRASFAAGNWVANTPLKPGTRWHSPYAPRTTQARPDYRLQPFTSRKLQPHLVIAN